MPKHDKMNPQNSTPTPPKHDDMNFSYHGFPETPTGVSESEIRRNRIISIIIFAFLLLFALFPYLKRQFPALEKQIDPAAYSEHQGDRFFEKQRYAQAKKAYLRSLKQGSFFSKKRNPQDRSRVHYKIALCNLHLKEEDKAIHHAERSIALNSGWTVPVPYEMLLFLYNKKQRRKDILRIAQLYQKIFPKEWRTYFMIGNSFTQLGDFKLALNYFKKGLKEAPNNPYLLGGLARAMMFMAQQNPTKLHKSLKIAQKAYNLGNNKSFGLTDTLAEIHLRLKHPKKALFYAKKGIELVKKNPALHKIALQRLALIQQAITHQRYQTYFVLQKKLSPSKTSSSHPSPQQRHPHTTSQPSRILPKITSLSPHQKQPISSQPTTTPTRNTMKKNTFRPQFQPVPLPQKEFHKRSKHPILPF